jgi:class 3 adenylate cyclase
MQNTSQKTVPDASRRSETRQEETNLIFPVSMFVKVGTARELVEVVNYHHKGACLRFHTVPPGLIESLRSQDAVLDFYIGKKCIRPAISYRLAWQSLDQDRTIGVEFLTDTNEYVARPPRYAVHPEFAPQLHCMDPLDPNRSVFFRVVNISENGMLLLSSLSNKHLLPGLSLKNATLSIPGQEPLRLSVFIANTRRSQFEGMFELGAAVEGDRTEYTSLARRYISILSPGSSDREPMADALEPIVLSKSLKQGLSYRIVKDSKDYEKVLKLRFKAYGAHGKVKTGSRWQDQGEGLENEGTIVAGFLGSKLISTVELRFSDTSIPFRMLKYFPDGKLPLEANRRTVEFNKLAIHPSAQGSDILIGMFQRIHSICVGKGGYDVIIAATDKLAPLYMRVGFKKSTIRMPHPYLPDQPLWLLIMPMEYYMEAKQINPVAWVTVFESTQHFLESVGMALPLEHQWRYRLKRRVGELLAPWVLRKRGSKRPSEIAKAKERTTSSTDNSFVDPKWTSQHIIAPIIKPYLLEADEMIGADKVDQILSAIGVPRSFFNRHGNWVSIAFLDEFLERFSKSGSIAELSRRAGERSLKPDQIGFKYFLLKHFVTVNQAVNSTEKLLSKFNQTRSYRPFDSRRNHFKIAIGSIPGMPLPKHRESCLNWQASFEAYFKVMTGTVGSVKKLACVYDGHDACIYQLDWTQSQRAISTLVISILGLALILGYHALGLSGFDSPEFSWMPPLLLCLGLGTLVLRSSLLRKKEGAAFAKQFERLEQEGNEKYSELQQAKKVLDERYREARLLEETAKAIQASTELKDTLKVSLDAICSHFEFDRAFIMLADENAQVLRTSAVSSTHRHLDALWKFEVNISAVRESGFFISSVFHTGSPVLIDNIETHLFQFNEQSQSLIRALETRGFIMVAIPSEKGRWGVLIADKTSPQKTLDRKDLTLLQRVAQHIGIALDKQAKLDHERKLRQLFQKYVPTHVVEQLHSRTSGALGGQIRHVFCLFVDIRDFTRTSEKLPPQATLDLVNRVFTLVQSIVAKNQGWIDKFLGDGALVTWGAVNDTPPEARLPIQTALEIVGSLEPLNAQLQADGLPRVRLGLGLHSGPALVGNVGASSRMEFTSIGQTVNIASRLESLCKELTASIVISEQVLETLTKEERERFQVKPEVSIRGIEKPVRVAYLPQETIRNEAKNG